MKLSEAQARVLRWMVEHDKAIGEGLGMGRSWFCPGGGGPHITRPTGDALRKRGLVEFDHGSFPIKYYRIAAAGRAALADREDDDGSL